MFLKLAILSVLLFPCLLNGQETEVKSPVANTPELKVLEHYIGKWDIQITSLASTDEVKLGGQAKAKWIAGGRYVQQQVTMRVAPQAPTINIENIMGWDPEEKTYRVWSFSSHDTPKEFKSKWDAEKKTMRSVSEIGPGITATTTANFSTDGKEVWKIVIASEDRGKLAEISGESSKK